MNKIQKRQRRIKHIRKKISGSDLIPRLTVFRSNKHIYAQLVNDLEHKTILFGSDSKEVKGKKSESSLNVGREIGKKIVQNGIQKIVFDRRGYKYHGRVKAIADGIREAGVIF